MLYWPVYVVLLGCSAVVTSILLDDTTCLAPSPCFCLKQFVDCSSKHLNQLPSFKGNSGASMQSHVLYIYLFSNNLSVIPDNGFSALRLAGATSINIYLYKNAIYEIRDNAFSGIENLVNELDIENNRLTALPTAIGKLRHLKVLKIQDNYLRTLDVTVLQNVGNWLTDLHFSADYLSQWPSSWSILSRLTNLQIDKIISRTLPNNTFNGLDHTLTDLTIYGSNLDSLPDAICTLRVLQSLTFGRNAHLTGVMPDSLASLCLQPMTSVKTIRFSSNDFRYFPNLFFDFPNASSITVIDNPNLLYVPSELIMSAHNLTELNLERNNLSSVPHGIGKLHNLRNLNLQNNLIRVVDGDVFDNLNQLTSLTLKNNPTVYIENSAFSGLTSLQTLDLESTGFKSIPRAVLSLPKLTSLDLTNLLPNCTCNLSHHMPWTQGGNITISGQCSDNILSIQNYVRHYLPLCK